MPTVWLSSAYGQIMRRSTRHHHHPRRDTGKSTRQEPAAQGGESCSAMSRPFTGHRDSVIFDRHCRMVREERRPLSAVEPLPRYPQLIAQKYFRPFPVFDAASLQRMMPLNEMRAPSAQLDKRSKFSPPAACLRPMLHERQIYAFGCRTTARTGSIDRRTRLGSPGPDASRFPGQEIRRKTLSRTSGMPENRSSSEGPGSSRTGRLQPISERCDKGQHVTTSVIMTSRRLNPRSFHHPPFSAISPDSDHAGCGITLRATDRSSAQIQAPGVAASHRRKTDAVVGEADAVYGNRRRSALCVR